MCSLHLACACAGTIQDPPLIYRINQDPSERFPLDHAGPTTKSEYAAQLQIATAAVERHIASLSAVPNQFAFGDDDRITQKGGSKLCGCPEVPNCLCDPENLKVEVCADDPLPPLPSLNAPTGAKKPWSGAQNKPNVVVLFVDDSGYGDWSSYGAPTTLTPNVDQLAKNGARFTQWYSAHAICTPSRAAMVTGRLPVRFGLASCTQGGQCVFGCTADKGLPANETTFAELLKGQGYKTAMIGKWHLGNTFYTLHRLRI